MSKRFSLLVYSTQLAFCPKYTDYIDDINNPISAEVEPGKCRGIKCKLKVASLIFNSAQLRVKC